MIRRDLPGEEDLAFAHPTGDLAAHLLDRRDRIGERLFRFRVIARAAAEQGQRGHELIELRHFARERRSLFGLRARRRFVAAGLGDLSEAERAGASPETSRNSRARRRLCAIISRGASGCPHFNSRSPRIASEVSTRGWKLTLSATLARVQYSPSPDRNPPIAS